jgi:hypothetical protein
MTSGPRVLTAAASGRTQQRRIAVLARAAVVSGLVCLTSALSASPSVPEARAAGSSTAVAAAPTLEGAYVLSLTGRDVNGLVFWIASFQADAAGAISNGVLDRASLLGVVQNLGVTGSYTLGGDGRGTLSLTDSAGVTANLVFVLEGGDRAQVMWFEDGKHATGTLERQDASALSSGALLGSFAFHLDGVDATGYSASWVGRFSLGSSGITGGQADLNDGGRVGSAALAFTGSYTPPGAGGRGTLTLAMSGGTLDLVYYVVSASRLILLERDFTYFLSGGAAERQQTTSFTAATLAGRYAFITSGYSAVGFNVDIGQLQADASGAITGLVDENDASVTAPSVGRPLSGKLAFTDTGSGRGTLTLNLPIGSASYVFYALGSSRVFLVEMDSSRITSGDLRAQTASSTASLTGNWGYAISGRGPAGLIERVAQLAADAQGALVGNEAQNPTAPAPFSQAVGADSSYAIDANGHGQLRISTPAGTNVLTFYLVSPTQILIQGTLDGAQLVAGEGNRQSF